MDQNLHNTDWDCCVIGNGVAALWVSHWLWSSKKSVLWITSEEPYGASRAMLQHGWMWGVSPDNAKALQSQLQGFAVSASAAEGNELAPQDLFEAVYFDAKTHKRFKRFSEAKLEWGSHEREYFESLVASLPKPPAAGATSEDVPLSPQPLDLWDWHEKLHRFHDTGASHGPTFIELFSEPRFVRAQGWPLLELRTEEKKISGVVLAGMRPDEHMEVRAKTFFLADFDEPLQSFVKNHDDSQTLAGALKGRSYRAGFGLRLWHKAPVAAPVQTMVLPLVVSPEKDKASHVAGRIMNGESSAESYWVGLLTDEELEDNNEILKKIKQAKRAVERALPGFIDSISREAVTFEPKMRASDLVKKRRSMALGAVLLSDHYGAEFAAELVKKVFSGQVGEEQETEKAPSRRSSKKSKTAASEPEQEAGA